MAFVTQYDVEAYQRLEQVIKQKLPEFPCDEETVLVLLERVNEAQRLATRELREMQAQDPKKRKRKGDRGGEGDRDRDDEEESNAAPSFDSKIKLKSAEKIATANGKLSKNAVRLKRPRGR